jgi:HPt (histidine-containing phosphotransfer) domain-containing protein
MSMSGVGRVSKDTGELLKGRIQREAQQRAAARLDLEHLRHYTLGDRALQAEVLELFRVQARVQLDLISIASLPGDFNLAVHTLKGAALVIGAKAIVATTKELETLRFSNDAAKRRQLIYRLAEEIALVEAEIAEIVA